MGLYKIIMADRMAFSKRDQYFEDMAKLFKALIKFRLKIPPHKCQFFQRSFNIHDSYLHAERWLTIIHTHERKLLCNH